MGYIDFQHYKLVNVVIIYIIRWKIWIRNPTCDEKLYILLLKFLHCQGLKDWTEAWVWPKKGLKDWALKNQGTVPTLVKTE